LQFWLSKTKSRKQNERIGKFEGLQRTSPSLPDEVPRSAGAAAHFILQFLAVARFCAMELITILNSHGGVAPPSMKIRAVVAPAVSSKRRGAGPKRLLAIESRILNWPG